MNWIRALTRPVSAWWPPLLLMALVIAVVFLQLHWVGLDSTQLRDDDATLYAHSLCLEQKSLGIRAVCRSPYPPLVPAIAAAHYRLLGRHDLTLAVQSLWPWYVLLMAALFVGVRREAGSLGGLAAAALGPVLATSLYLRGSFYTEIPLLAVILASVVCLAASEGLTRRRASIGLGLCLAAGLLTKWTFAVFMGPPMVLAVLLALWKARHAEHRRARLVGVALAALPVVALAMPWYVSSLEGLRTFLALNLAGVYHGDKMGPAETWVYYPAVLLTRVLSTPLVALFALGALRLLLPGRSPLAAWSLATLISGVGILATLPYRAARYLGAALGLIVPIALSPFSRPRWLARPMMALVLAASLFYLVSWIPMTADGRGFYLPAAFLSPPRKDLFGNIRSSMVEARRSLHQPRWHLNAVAAPPVRERSPNSRIVSGLRARSGRSPFYAVLIDPAGLSNADVLKVEAAAREQGACSTVVPEPGGATPDVLARHLASLGATTSAPTNFFVITVTDLGNPWHLEQGRQTMALLKSLGFGVTLRDGLPRPPDAIVQVWRHAAPEAAVDLCRRR